MPLTLTYRGSTTVPVEVDGLGPTALRERTLREIERLPIDRGNRSVPLAELFDVSGDPSDEQLVFAGDLAGVHGIGTRLERGLVRVEGNAGRHLGAGMRGGEIYVAGNVGDWAGAELRGGLLRVRGNAGNHAGSAYCGDPLGMTGGTLLIEGNAGEQVGRNMRRGLLVVGGDVGDAPALNMIAGTILVFGTTGRRPAAGMRRGTLAVFGKPPKLLPTFRSTGVCRLLFLQLYFAALRRHGFAVPQRFDRAPMAMFTGDLLGPGKGEVLVPVASGT